MRYIYYIAGILILITLGLAIRLSGIKVEVSEPALVVNDRIISKTELEEFAEVGSYHSRGSGFLDAVITRELLIQEAIRQGIHKEEDFRKSVEAYYEQSLIKTLIDRKLESLSPEVTPEMVERYKKMCLKTVEYTKFVYESEGDVEAGKIASTMQQVHDFEDLSDAMKFSLFRLTPGGRSLPESTAEGIVVYRLDRAFDAPEADAVPDDEEARAFLTDQAKEAMFDKWLGGIRTAADIREISNSRK